MSLLCNNYAIEKKDIKFLRMQQNQQFIESLFGLREHYQALNEECERKATQVREQLIHVNALLVEQLIESQQFVESLMRLREHYQGLNEQYERKVSNARVQLTHVNALLAEQLVLQHSEQQPVCIEASTINENENKALIGTADDADDIKGNASVQEIDKPTQPIALAPTDLVGLDDTQNALSQDIPASLDQQTDTKPAVVAKTEHTAVDVKSPSSGSLRFNTNKKPASSKRRFAPKSRNELQVLPKYRSLSKFEAVMQLLQSNAGSILHVDYIVRTLYGELEPNAFKLAKDRVSNTLYTGHKQKNLWTKVPDQIGCYTLDLKLVDPD